MNVLKLMESNIHADGYLFFFVHFLLIACQLSFTIGVRAFGQVVKCGKSTA